MKARPLRMLREINRENSLQASKIVFILLLCSSLLVYLKIPYIGYGLNNFLLPCFALLLVALNLQHFNEAFRCHRQALFFLFLFYVWMWVSALFSDFQGIALKYSIKYSIHFIVLVSFLILTYKKRDPFSYYRWILRFLILLAVFGIVEYLFHDLWFFPLLRSPRSLDVYPRISSLLQWPNQLGILMGVGIPLGLLLHKDKSISDLEFYFGLFLLTIVISLAASRNAWLILLLGIFLAWLWRVITLRKGLSIIIFLFFCVLFFPIATHQLGIRGSKLLPLSKHVPGKIRVVDLNKPALFTPRETSTSRLVLWKAAIHEISKRPVTGVGIEVFEKIIGKRIRKEEGYHTHNLFLNILVELGIPGLLLFLVFIYSLLKRADLYRPIIGIPLIMVFAAQLVDFFMHDFTFTTIGLYFLAEAGNSQHEDN
jgi:O-antigen ligase